MKKRYLIDVDGGVSELTPPLRKPESAVYWAVRKYPGAGFRVYDFPDSEGKEEAVLIAFYNGEKA